MVHLEVMLPNHAPKAYEDWGVLWNSLEQVEDQRNAQMEAEEKRNQPRRKEWDMVI